MVRDSDLTNGGKILELARRDDRSGALDEVRRLTEEALKQTGRGLDLTQADLSGLDLSRFDLRGAVLNRTSLYGTRLVGCDLTGASMVCAGIERTDFSAATLRGAYAHAFAAQASKFVSADLSDLVDATGALFHGCDLSKARMDRAELAGTTFYQCNLNAGSAVGADLHGATLSECKLNWLDLSTAHLDDVTITRCSLRGTVLRKAQGRGLVIQRPYDADEIDLSQAHLPLLRLANVRAGLVSAAELRAPEIDVYQSNLPDVVLADADLRNGRWSNVCLDGANLANAGLAGGVMAHTSVRRASMTSVTAEGFVATECDFTDASMNGFAGRYVTFRNCNLGGADLRGAYLYRAVIVGDPPSAANMTKARLDGANLTQAYLAADFTDAQMAGGWATYARLNQLIFARADLRGTGMFRASAVKTDFTDVHLGGQRGAIFADRCPGLMDALRASEDSSLVPLTAWLSTFTDALDEDRGKST